MRMGGVYSGQHRRTAIGMRVFHQQHGSRTQSYQLPIDQPQEPRHAMTSRVNGGYNEIRLDRLRTANNRFMRGIIPFGGHAYLDAVQAQAGGKRLPTANRLLP